MNYTDNIARLAQRYMVPSYSGSREENSEIELEPTICELCNVSLISQIDIAKHIKSDEHAINKIKHRKLFKHPGKSVESEIPKNLVKLLDSLQIKSKQNLSDLNSKGFFDINDDNTMHVADQIAYHMGEELIEFEIRDIKLEKSKQDIRDYFEKFLHSYENATYNPPVAPTSNKKRAATEPVASTSTSQQVNSQRPTTMRPEPNLNSDYKPKLAKIKIEPE